MIKLNRIGNKLGLAGLVGVLLSGGMVVNQMVSESAINSANQRADTQQAVAVHALEGNIGFPCGGRYDVICNGIDCRIPARPIMENPIQSSG